MITPFDHLEPVAEPPAQFSLRRQTDRADDLVVRAFALPAARSPRGSTQASVPVQFTETAFTPRIRQLA